MSQKNFSFREWLFNTFMVVFVFLIALMISSQALTRKVNSFQSITSPVFFEVDKKDLVINAQVEGRVKTINVTSGQSVKAGELIVELDSTAFERRVSLLEEVADQNLSARTELSVLREDADSFKIYAPQDGVIDDINISEGSYVNREARVLTMFSDTDTRLTSFVTPDQYSEIQNSGSVNVYSDRLEQTFKAKLDGVRQATRGAGNQGFNQNTGDSFFELIFRFENAEDGAIFIEKESLQLINPAEEESITRPSDRLARIWNALILGR